MNDKHAAIEETLLNTTVMTLSQITPVTHIPIERTYKSINQIKSMVESDMATCDFCQKWFTPVDINLIESILEDYTEQGIVDKRGNAHFIYVVEWTKRNIVNNLKLDTIDNKGNI